MNVMKKLSVLMVFIICTACSPYGYNRLSTHELDELRTLCEKDAGLKIYMTVEADGYYDASWEGGGIMASYFF